MPNEGMPAYLLSVRCCKSDCGIRPAEIIHTLLRLGTVPFQNIAWCQTIKMLRKQLLVRFGQQFIVREGRPNSKLARKSIL